MGTFYDREIEYLESTGTQYIDTGIDFIYGVNEIEVYLDVRFNSSSKRQLMGSNGYGYLGINVDDYFESSCGVTTIQRDFDFHKLKLIISPSTANISFTVDSTTITAGYTLTSYIYRCYLFALGGRDNAAASFLCDACIKRAYIIIDNKKVRDFIPVRVGTTGYLFDRVSCQLFGNAGTGNFVLGDDMYDARVEYVGTRGLGKAFPTGYIPTGTDIVIDMTVKFQGFTAKTGAFFYTWNSDTTTECYCLWRNGTTNNQLTIRCGNKQSQASTVTYTLSTGTTYNFRVKWGQAAINYGTYTINTTAATNQNSSSLYLSTSNTEQGMNQDIYHFKVYKASVLVCDLIPVRKGQTPCVYDRVTNRTFEGYGNGTGSLVMGNDIPDIPYEAEIEYLKSDGNAYLCLMPIKNISPDVANWSMDVMKVRSATEVFGGMSTNSMQLVFLSGSFRNDWALASGASFAYATVSNNVKYTLKQENGILSINNTSFTCNKNMTETTLFYLFTRNPRETSTHFTGRIYGMKVWSRSTGEILYDYIPVRIKDVGYFYDKINGTLHGNIGSGSFVLGPDKPMSYDAELDYITFDSSQSINTGLYGNLNTEVELTCRCPSAVNMSIFGARLSSGNDGITSYRSSFPSLYANIYDNSNYRAMQSNYYNDWVTIKINKDSRQIKSLNKTLYTTNNTECSSDFITPNTMRIGGFESVISDLTYRNFVGCLGTVKIWQNNTLVRDYIPVKKYNIGYLYDKVTNKLFRNDFPSSFALGPIKEKPTPIIPSDDGISRYFSRRDLLIEDAKIKPYVTSGLVFHLDGEDYDDTEKTWTSRIGNYTFTMTGTTKSSDGLGVYFNGNAYSTYANFMAHAASSFTLEVVYEKTGANASVWNGGNGAWICYRRVGNNVWRQTGTTITVCPETYGKVTHALTNAVSICNGDNLGFSSGSTYYNRGTNSNAYIGRDNNNQYRMVGNIYQIRLYDRKLTNAEIFHNQEIDRKRYGITFK